MNARDRMSRLAKKTAHAILNRLAEDDRGIDADRFNGSQSLFDRLDQDGDGFVSQNELTDAIEHSLRVAAARQPDLDLNIVALKWLAELEPQLQVPIMPVNGNGTLRTAHHPRQTTRVRRDVPNRTERNEVNFVV